MRASGWLFNILFLTALWFSGCMLGDSLLHMREHSKMKATKKIEQRNSDYDRGIALPFPAPEQQISHIMDEQIE